MTNFHLHMEQKRDETPVSNIFIDEYMPTANGAYVKIYLYLLRCMTCGTQTLSVPAIADRFDHTENDVHRALAYWEKMKLLRLEYDANHTLTGICLLDPISRKEALKAEPNPLPATSKRQDAPKCLDAGSVNPPGDISQTLERPAQAPPAKAASDPIVPPKSYYTADQLAKFQEEKEITEILLVSEEYLQKTLSPTEISTLLYFYDSLHFSADLIEYLVEYCANKGHKNMRYIESVALAWHKAGYTTVSQAKQECANYSKPYFAVLKAFGIKNRDPGKPEIHYIDRWMDELHFSIELIVEACNRTIAAIHQPSFEYADSILTKWHASQIKTLEDIKALDAKRTKKAPQENSKSEPAAKKTSAPNRFHNFKQRDYDFAELERQLSEI